MKIKIWKGLKEVVREIETNRTWVSDGLAAGEQLGPNNLIEFFESCTPPHTGSWISGSIVEDINQYGIVTSQYFEGEYYEIEE